MAARYRDPRMLSRHGHRGPLLVLLLALAAMLAVAAPTLGASRRTGGLVRVGSAPQLPAGTQPAGVVSPTRSLHLTVALAPRTPAALAAYAAAVSDPTSSLFHRFLSPAGFVRRFAPRAAQVAAVLASLRRHGLSPGAVSANGLAIPVQATAGAIERAFSISLVAVRLPSGRTATLSLSAPALDRAVAGSVQAVIGLNGLDHPVPADPPRSTRVSHASSAARPQVATGGPRPCATARNDAGPNSAYTADQIASAYRFSGLFRHGDKGRGVTIALYELEPNAKADIAAYQHCYGTHTPISYIKVDGGSGSGDGGGEAALDIEQVIGLAPRARVLVYQGPNSNIGSPGSGPFDVYSKIISQDRASVVSTSWGECEPLQGQSTAEAENTLFEEAAAQGQTVVAASGDSGSEGCYNPMSGGLPDTEQAVVDPASQPFVTGVGGTTLSSLGPPPGETTWNSGGPLFGGASGGGVSTFWRMPVYQRKAPKSLRVIQGDSSGSLCGAGGGAHCREVPDVSADADPNTGYLIYFNGDGSDLSDPSQGWQGIGGTSGAAPLWAALVALADANRACGRARLGFVNPALYRLAARGEHTYFNDVTSGNNDLTGTNGGRYPAGRNYDMTTGLGTPNGDAVALGMCREGLRLLDPGTQRSRLHKRVTLRLHVSDARGAGLALSVRGLPPGLRLRSGGHRIKGRTLHSGTYHVTVRATDGNGATRTIHFIWKVRG